MQDLSYQRYLQDPTIRAEIEAEVVRLRRETFERYLFQPVLRCLRKLFRRAPRTNGPTNAPTNTPVPPRGQSRQSSLDKQGTVVFSNARDLEIQLLVGSLWITQDGDSADYTLGPGQTFRVRRPGATVVYALQPSSISIAYPVAPRTTAVATAASVLRAALSHAHLAWPSGHGHHPANTPI